MTALHLTFFDLAFVITSLLSIVRLITYQRGGSTFKRGKSLIAWALLCAFAWVALVVITGQKDAVDFPIVTLPIMLLITLLVFYTHGNISALFRIITRIT